MLRNTELVKSCSKCIGWFVQGCLYRVVCTGWFVQGGLYRVVCTGLFVQGGLYRVVCTGWFVQGGLYRVVCTGRFAQGCLYRLVCQHEDLNTPLSTEGLHVYGQNLSKTTPPAFVILQLKDTYLCTLFNNTTLKPNISSCTVTWYQNHCSC